MPEKIDASVIETAKELMEGDYYEEEIEEKLKKMTYSDEQIKVIIKEAKSLIDDKKRKLKRMKLVAIILSFILFMFGITLIALIQAA